MERTCFVLKLKKETVLEYIEHHKAVWPEMLDALRTTGWTNYSLFLGPDEMLVDYVEAKDFGRALSEMKNFPVNQRWQKLMSPFFDSDNRPDEGTKLLPMIFHLD